jgi:hypothetical protein
VRTVPLIVSLHLGMVLEGKDPFAGERFQIFSTIKPGVSPFWRQGGDLSMVAE